MKRSHMGFGESELDASFEQRTSAQYQSLSTKLQQAADFVLAHPMDVASRSLRTVSRDSNLAPATFSRLSRALGYENYEALRDEMRASVARPNQSFSDRVERLQQEHGAGEHDFLSNHFASCSANIQSFATTIDRQSLERTVEMLHRAPRVLILGALGSTGVAEYMNYMASFISDKWNLAGRQGASLASGLVGIGADDVILIVTKPPFAKQSISAAQEANAQGANVVVITDTHACPALKFAHERFIVPTASANFFSSYATTLALVEAIVGMVASRAGTIARDRILKVENKNMRLGEIWDQ